MLLVPVRTGPDRNDPRLVRGAGRVGPGVPTAAARPDCGGVESARPWHRRGSPLRLGEQAGGWGAARRVTLGGSAARSEGPGGRRHHLLGSGTVQSIFGLTPSQLSGPATTVTRTVPAFAQ